MAPATSSRRRLRGISRALAATTTEEVPLLRQMEPMAALPEQASLSADGLVLLKDHQVQTFCADGFLLVRPSSLSRQFHEELVEQLDAGVADGAGGNNLLVRSPDLMRVWADPAIVGAARSLAGPGCDLHSHRHAHVTTGSPDNAGSQQTWHKDPFNDDPYVRHKHCFRWVFALYYPQDTPIELGPTGILRGCHNLMGIGHRLDAAAGTMQGRVEESAFGITAESGFVDPALITEKEVPDHPKQPMVCPAGSVAFIHMDSWHGAGANILEGAKRYMIKCHYVRMTEPCLTGPTWDHDPANREWTPQTTDDVTPRASKATWDWLCGDAPPPQEADERDTDTLMAGLEGSETERVDAAIALGERAATDPSVVPQLMEKLRSEVQGGALAEEIATGWAASIPRAGWDGTFNPAALRSLNPADTDVSHALSAAGAAALPELLGVLEDQQQEPWWAACTAVSVLGSLGHVAKEAMGSDQLRIVDGLLEALDHEHVWVRRNAADALGTTVPLLQQLTTMGHGTAIVDAVIDGLATLATNDTSSIAVETETARLSATIALARLAGSQSGEGTLALGEAGMEAVVRNMRERRPDRVNPATRHYAAAALRRDGGAAAMQALVDGLLLSRWL